MGVYLYFLENPVDRLVLSNDNNRVLYSSYDIATMVMARAVAIYALEPFIANSVVATA